MQANATSASWFRDHDGSWKTWTFGESLRLKPTSATTPSGGSRRSDDLKEEGIETLLMLNLDLLFPNLHLRLAEKELGAWAGADISAVDPTGRRHVFEVKHGSTARNVVDQAIAYGFQGLSRRAISWFDEQENQTLVAAARQAGFWAGERVQTLSLSQEQKKYAPSYKTVAIYEELTGGPASMEVLTRASSETCESLKVSPAWKRNADSDAFGISGVHLHMVIPDARSIEKSALQILRRLVGRGVYATIWEFAIELDQERRSGRIWLKPFDVLANPAESDDGGNQEYTGEVSEVISKSEVVRTGLWFPGIDELLCSMSLQPPGLEVLRCDWIHEPAKQESFLLAWPQTKLRQSLRFGLKKMGKFIQCEVRTSSRPQWIWDHPVTAVRDDYRTRVRRRRRYMAEWLLSVVEFEGYEGPTELFAPFSASKSETWGFVGAKNDERVTTALGGHPVRVYHPGEMLAASITLDVEELGVSTVAMVCADALARFREIAGTACYDDEAFGPFEEISPFDAPDSAES